MQLLLGNCERARTRSPLLRTKYLVLTVLAVAVAGTAAAAAAAAFALVPNHILHFTYSSLCFIQFGFLVAARVAGSATDVSLHKITE